MNNEELNRLINKAEQDYDNMKERYSELIDENKSLKTKMRDMSYNKLYLRKDELGWINRYFDTDLISIDDLIAYIEDLHADLDRLQEKYDDLQEDVETNYRRIDRIIW